MIQITNSTLLIDFQRAQTQIDDDRLEAGKREEPGCVVDPGSAGPSGTGAIMPREPGPGDTEIERVLARFYGSVRIDSERYSREIGNVTREVLDRLAGTGATIEITIEIEATKADGFKESEVRTISENTNVLKFQHGSGFEEV